jgi:hypothetical protein
VATPPPPKVEELPKKLVKIEKCYLFAGKNIVYVCPFFPLYSVLSDVKRGG